MERPIIENPFLEAYKAQVVAGILKGDDGASKLLDILGSGIDAADYFF